MTRVPVALELLRSIKVHIPVHLKIHSIQENDLQLILDTQSVAVSSIADAAPLDKRESVP